ncbi:AMP-binding protein, partial [Mycolicibacter sinensis]|uniref:AMP-binding protein n=1 Tax=Mycolicibacter sinensis (strain JDM601) TaxID=875328 RepID=UPI000AE33724
MNLFTCLEQAAARFGEHGAVYHGVRQLHTWRELAERARRLAASLRAAVAPGARIAIASENRPEIIELMFATWAADCAVVPLNYKLHPREMAQIISDAGAAWVFASPKLAPDLAAAVGAPVETIGSTAYLERFAHEPATPPDPDPSRLAWLFYTSGTTGRSKGAM